MYKMLISLIAIALLFNNIVSVPSLKFTNAKDLNQERVLDSGTKHFEDGKHNVEFDHEVILGSVHNAAEFERLTPEESQKRLRVLLTKMDINNNEIIERNELKAWIIRSFKTLADEDAQEHFKDIDMDSDNLITWKEYLIDAYGSDNEISQNLELDSSTDKIIMYDKMIYETADINNDGVLDGEEFKIFNAPEEYDLTAPIVVNQTLEERDKNGDGQISFEEYLPNNAGEQNNEWMISEEEKFRAFDENNSGFLERDEIKNWIIPSNEEMADEEADHLFFESDDNDDRVLSFDEIISHYDVFVGSDQFSELQHDEL